MNEFDFYEERDGRVYTVTSSGWEVECCPVGDLLLRVGASSVLPTEPDPPTYSVTDVSGEVSTFPHDEESIKDDKTTEEEIAQWGEYRIKMAAYDVEVDELEQRRREQRGRFLALRGMIVQNLPDLKEWAKEQDELYGFIIPDDERERLAEFVNTEVIRVANDGNKVVIGIYKASGMDQEVLSSIEDRFRDSMGWPKREDAPTDPEVSPEEE